MTEEKYSTLSPAPGPIKASEHRKSSKPIMEKRRRARINQSLGELKSLILDAMKKDSSRHSKLEKADILELTVKHLQSLQRQQMAVAVNQDPSVLSKYRAGYNHCATEVARYLSSVDGLDANVRTQLISHLSSNMRALDAHVQYNATVGAVSPVQVHVPNGVPTVNFTPQVPYTVNVVPKVQYTSDNNGTPQFYSSVGVQLIPSTLPTGEIAFVLPSPQLNSTSMPIRQNTQRTESNEILPPSPASSSFLSASPSSSSSSPPSTSSSSSSPAFLFSVPTTTSVTITNNLSPSSSGASLSVCSSVCSPSKLQTVNTKQSNCRLVNVKEENMWRPW